MEAKKYSNQVKIGKILQEKTSMLMEDVWLRMEITSIGLATNVAKTIVWA